LRGGRGTNFNGLTVSDPQGLFVIKPNVLKNCILDNESIATIGIS
jgi:hypothetical protein